MFLNKASKTHMYSALLGAMWSARGSTPAKSPETPREACMSLIVDKTVLCSSGFVIILVLIASIGFVITEVTTPATAPAVAAFNDPFLLLYSYATQCTVPQGISCTNV